MLEDKLIYLLNIFEKKYNDIKINNLFQKQQEEKTLLKFGYICPGALKTINYIHENVKTDSARKIYNNIKRYTDALFFIEIIALYYKYIDKDIVEYVDNFTNKKNCLLAKILTKMISQQFEKLPKYISKNLPDDFYHLRHKTLICSNDQNLVEERINMLKKIYEKYTNISKNVCDGKRDGISGCRDCCKKHFGSGNNYQACVNSCMKD